MQLQYIAGGVCRSIESFIDPWSSWRSPPLPPVADKDSPDQQVRAVIEQMEQAAENRDVGDLKAHLSEDYRDANGMGLKRWHVMRGATSSPIKPFICSLASRS